MENTVEQGTTSKIDSRRVAIFLGLVYSIAALPILALTGNPNVLLGPSPVGLIGAIGFEVVALILFVSPLGRVALPAAKDNIT